MWLSTMLGNKHGNAQKRKYRPPGWVRPVGRKVLWKPVDGGSETVAVNKVVADTVWLTFSDGTVREFMGAEIEYFLDPLLHRDDSNPFDRGLSQYVPLFAFQHGGSTLAVAIVRDGRPRLLWRGDVVAVRLQRNQEGFFQIESFIRKRGQIAAVHGRWLYTFQELLQSLRETSYKHPDNDPQLLLSSQEADIDIDTINEPVSVKPEYLFRPDMDDYYVKSHYDAISKVVTPVLVTVADDLLASKYRCDMGLANDLHRTSSEAARKRMKMVWASRVARLSESSAGVDIEFDITWPGLLNFEDSLLKKGRLEVFTVKKNKQQVTEQHLTWRINAEDLIPELGNDWNQLTMGGKSKQAADRVVLDGVILMCWSRLNPNKLTMRVEKVDLEKDNGVKLNSVSVAPPEARLAVGTAANHGSGAAAASQANAAQGEVSEHEQGGVCMHEQGEDSDNDPEDDIPLGVLKASLSRT